MKEEETRERDELAMRARVTQLQFQALAVRCNPTVVLQQLSGLAYRTRIKAGVKADQGVVRKLLLNGWNTECLLRINVNHLGGDALRHSLHWAFPQAYYSAYTVAQAFFEAIGHSERTHTSVIRKFGHEVKLGRYPVALSFVAEGSREPQFTGVQRRELPSPLHFDPTSKVVVNSHIARFLNGTRTIDLAAKRQDMKFKRKDGKPKKSLSPNEWARVADTLGPTSLMSLLYRKRIKANYRDIDTLLSDKLDPAQLYRDLVSVVESLNLVHESYIIAMLGEDALAPVLTGLTGKEHAFVRERVERLRTLAA